MSGTCATCKTGTCTGECCAAGCCHGQAAAGSCSASGCKCDGSGCHSSESASATTSYEETSTECPACHAGKHFSIGLGFGTGGLHLMGPIVWFNKGAEPRCAACEENNQIADSEDGHDFESSNMLPPPPAPPAGAHSFVITTDGAGHILMDDGNTTFISGPPQISCSQAGCGINFVPAKTIFGAQVLERRR